MNTAIRTGATIITGLALGISLQTFLQKSAFADTSGRVTEPTRIREPYKGQGCACPYDLAKDNSICGGRSAYARPGGKGDPCYVGETTVRQLWWYSDTTKFVDPRPGR